MNSKKYGEELNLTIHYEITKEFKEFKFQQNLSTEFIKNDETFKNKIFADKIFDSEKLEFIDTNIDELIDIQHN